MALAYEDASPKDYSFCLLFLSPKQDVLSNFAIASTQKNKLFIVYIAKVSV